jgi:hypothetical protein
MAEWLVTAIGPKIAECPEMEEGPRDGEVALRCGSSTEMTNQT